MSRREFLQASALAGIVPFLDIGLMTGTDSIDVTRHVVRTERASSHSVVVAQLSDLHLRSIVPLQNSLAKKVNAEKPDAILITGDAIDSHADVQLLDNFLKLLLDVPKVAILGNHEMESGISLEELAAIYEDNNGILLVNRTIPLAEEGMLSRILVTGLGDPLSGTQNLKEALHHTNRSPNHILMAHRPLLSVETTAQLAHTRHRFNLMLAGHTHGGQINILGFTPVLPKGSGSYVKGWYVNYGVPMYVSRGIGTVMMPVRIGSKPEVAIFKYYLS